MRKVIFAINMTLDGGFSHEDGIPDEEMHQYFTELMKGASVVLFGRKTYELLFPYWHTIAVEQSDTPTSNEFARLVDAVPKIVFSETLNEVASENTTISREPIEVALQRMKSEPGGDIYIDGLSVASHLMRLGMIDEFYFVVHPMVAGRGPRLFEDGALKEPLQLELIDSQTLGFGAVVLHYSKR